MTVNLFTFVDLYGRVLDTTAHILKKGAKFAADQGVDAETMLDWRLFDDMQALRFQVMVVQNFVRQWPARAAGLPLPGAIEADLTFEGFLAAITDAKAYLAALTPGQFEGRDAAPLTVMLGDGQMEPTLPAERWVTGFATTNVYFHLSMAYAILRARGAPLGKVDLFPTGL